MATTVVVKHLGRNIGYTTLQNKIYNLWRPSIRLNLWMSNMGCFGEIPKYGHMKTLCPLFVDKLDHPMEKEVALAGNVEGKENEAFGPWMLVEQKLQRLPNEKRNPKTKNPEKDLCRSRFNILEEETELDVEISVDFQGRKRRMGEAGMAKLGPRLKGAIATSSLGGSFVGVEIRPVLRDSRLHQASQSVTNMLSNNFPISSQINKVHLDAEIVGNI
ncbi:hypothetical protein GOBAR_AA31302 [Gossypium barbadense]|uniref:DUF4283 domain-containing protein n=1 Tax=Gossypium barbadense TaxID=3634 RepID=A0A2P5WE75_GOSBA|nr:hypothetical protein GOBAR_AA31302 [Gossypium barbadense]